MSELSQRTALASDKEFARGVHHAGYREVSERQFGPWNSREQDDYFERAWRPEATAILLLHGVPCGYAVIDDRTGEVHLEELVVHPMYQGRGVGTAVVRAAMARARGRGVPVRLRVFQQSRARTLYRRLGFEEYGSTPTQVLMEWRDLSPARSGGSR